MADLTIQKPSLTGLVATYQAASSTGDSFVNDGHAVLHVKNGDTADKTVTVDSVAKCNFGFDHDLSVTVAAGSEKIIGPFPTVRFNDSNRKVNVSYDAVTSVTVAALAL